MQGRALRFKPTYGLYALQWNLPLGSSRLCLTSRDSFPWGCRPGRKPKKKFNKCKCAYFNIMRMIGAELLFVLGSSVIIRQSTAIINWTNTTSQKLIFCNPQQYCIGEGCDLACNQTLRREIAFDNDLQFISTVDVDNSKGCIFYFPSDCEKCICVARTSPYVSQNVLKSCQPCQFKSVGWLQKTEMQKFAPEKAPIFFPTSCDMHLITAKGLGAMATSAFPSGIWIHFLGDSLLRGVFVHAVSFLSIRSNHIEIFWNLTKNSFGQQDGHISRFMCCSTKNSEVGTVKGEIGDCELHKLEGRYGTSLASRVAAEIITRRARSEIPICVSFAMSVYLNSYGEQFKEMEAAFTSTGIRPTSIVINPGIWELRRNFDLHELVEKLKRFQVACAALFDHPGGGVNASAPHEADNLPCIMMTTMDTAYTGEDIRSNLHRRLHHNILGYNAAVMATWLDGYMPLLDAGALSLHPAVINSIDRDKLHYGRIGKATDSSPANPMNPLCWQMILHTISSGAHPCEVEPLSWASDRTPDSGTSRPDLGSPRRVRGRNLPRLVVTRLEERLARQKREIAAAGHRTPGLSGR